MSFTENLLQKIRIKKLSREIEKSIVSGNTEKRTDLHTMRKLLETGEYTAQKERDMELFILEDGGEEKKKILVLDNDLPIYRTGIADVALRKSPTVKEMLNIRNAVKILNDSDVLVSKKAESLQYVREQCINRLDLTFGPGDLDEIANNGTASLEREYSAGVEEALDLFGELLSYVPAPNEFRKSSHKIIGYLQKNDRGEELFGPVLIYSLIHNTLRLIEKPLHRMNKEDAEMISQICAEKIKAAAEGPQVFAYLKEAVLSGKYAAGN